MIILVVNTLTTDLKSDNFLVGEPMVPTSIIATPCSACHVLLEGTLCQLIMNALNIAYHMHHSSPLVPTAWCTPSRDPNNNTWLSKAHTSPMVDHKALDFLDQTAAWCLTGQMGLLLQSILIWGLP